MTDQVGVFLIGRKSMCVEGLAAILGTFDDVSLLGRSFDWHEGVERVNALQPDVVVVDLAHCPECGPQTPLECIEALAGHNVVVMSAQDAGSSVVAALEAGAMGLLSLDSTDTASVHTTILSAAQGQTSLSPRLSSAVLSRMRTLSRSAAYGGSRDMPPTDREAEVLRLLVKGLSNREIAHDLLVSESTVKNHLHALYSKLGTSSRSQTVSEAIRRGLATP